MRVIDGFHRTFAARLKGFTHIDAYLMDGSEKLAFIVGVRENTTHGLPLPLTDRRAAAERIVQTHPHWSDRSIAATAGLSAKTVASIRSRLDGDQPSSHRLGSDGRLRPVDTNSARRTAAELIMARPHASLRSIAQEVGLSPSTIRDVRTKLKRGEYPFLRPDQNKTDQPVSVRENNPGYITDRLTPPDSRKPTDLDTLLALLSRDPALRMSTSGRDLLRWMHHRAVKGSDIEKISKAILPHTVDHILEFAQQCAANWSSIAQELQCHAITEQDSPRTASGPEIHKQVLTEILE
ncbi:hypothetical protein [Nocardia sp. CNY236]|uniref:hypothetical protein n=1 Tax=Nocardia sp. CNY236 TaxID=1169152 RepID=UPI000405C37D|nr:hypothetical protein [Nocardia sp. CNY236]